MEEKTLIQWGTDLYGSQRYGDKKPSRVERRRVSSFLASQTENPEDVLEIGGVCV
jgi:hypothetical protein